MMFDLSMIGNASLRSTLWENGFVSGALFLAISYTLGVTFNIIAGSFARLDHLFVDQRDDRMDDHSNGKKDQTQIAIEKAIKTTFDVDANPDSWRLCYGIAHKTQFGANIETFGRINIFCRSMMVSFAVILTLLAMSNIIIPFKNISLIYIVFSIIMFFVFLAGSRIYSRAFSSAIYESFYTWYCTKDDFGPEK